MLRYLLAALLCAAPLTAQTQSVRIQVIDVGQADGILIRTPNSQWILIDGGQGNGLANNLQSGFGVDTLDLVVGSHRHRDHIGGLDNILNRLPTDLYIGDLNDRSGQDDNRLRDTLTARGIQTGRPDPDTLTIDGVDVIILPRDPDNDASENDNTVMVRIEFGDFSMLFAGDAEEKLRDWLVDNHPGLLDADVLKASHHGSRNGTSPEFLEAVSPERVVLSSGVHAGFRHPHPEAVTAYESEVDEDRVYCTNRHGTIRIYGFPDGRIRVRRQRITNKSCVFDGTHY